MSEARRTQETAKPLASALGITPVEVPNGDAETIFQRAQADYPDDVVLIAGHSNTVPDLIRKWDENLHTVIKPGEDDKIFVLIPTGPGTAGLARLRSGRNDE